MNKKTIVIAMAMALSVFAGCGAGSSDGGNVETTAAPAASDESGDAATAEPAESADDEAAQDGDAAAEGKTVVKEENYPDCDGSGHGYKEITYSDGSTETIEY